MNTSALQFTTLQQQLFRLLCIKAGQKLNQRELAKELNVSPAGVAKAIQLLEKKEFIHIEKHHSMNLQLITLHRTPYIMRLKQTENLKQLYELALIDYLEENYPGTTIILFGSYAKGEDTTTSDIDIAIIGAKHKQVDMHIFEKKLERQININNYNSFKDIATELKENLCNGIILTGGVEL